MEETRRRRAFTEGTEGTEGTVRPYPWLMIRVRPMVVQWRIGPMITRICSRA
jgi:hypothetical protein